MTQRSLFLLLDIDNTLYEYETTGFGREMHDLIFAYAKEKLGITRDEAAALSVKYYRNYGLSLRGYVEHFGIDPKEYSDFVHQCSYDRLSYNKPLVDMLTRLHCGTTDPTSTSASAATDKKGKEGEEGEKKTEYLYGQQAKVLHHLYFFTNANRPHARKVLEPLGLKPLFTRPRQPGSPTTDAHRQYDEDGFESATEWLGFSYEDQWRLTGDALRANKPMQEAYEAIFKAIDEEIALDEQPRENANANSGDDAPVTTTKTGSPTSQFTAHKRAHLQPRNAVMVDDSLMNLDAPLKLGWNVVWYAHDNQQLPTDNALYADAVAAGRMQVIRDILDLEKAVEEIAKH